ncbi:dTMP kinase [Micromonospora echinospora]|uniref:Thymidylate kinase n=1 Tax=Micromonospora echinospora TaxID=1877 RepID=A0A1C4WG83_MICEC|nr:dTMP kinase [Micromonospora echinospora]OZV72312.1 dTMP kinase [Micromonospora echinospora]SCE95203.1 dTMP kinase [Micromonospora echinospora]
MLIVIEGPNGVGKTTVAGLLAERLRHRTGQPVHLTTEPTRTRLGELLREAEAVIHGRALALAIAADRTMHVEDEIIPALDAGTIVISDRYVQSSLVLQRVDAVDLREIWSYNRYVLQPAISIYLVDDPQVIATRLAARRRLTRLEATGTPERELQLYDQAFHFLNRQSWHQVKIDCWSLDPDQVVSAILDTLTPMLAQRPAA